MRPTALTVNVTHVRPSLAATDRESATPQPRSRHTDSPRGCISAELVHRARHLEGE